MLGVILIINSLFLVKDLLYYFELVISNGRIYNSLLTFDNWIVAIDAMYAMELVRPGSIDVKKFLLNLSFFLLFTIAYVVTGSQAVFVAFLVFTVFYAVVLLLSIYCFMQKYKRMVKEIRSDLTNVNVDWLWTCVTMLLVLLGLWLVVYLNGTESLDFIYYILMTTVWVVISIRTERQQMLDKGEREAVSTVTRQQEINMASFHFAEKLDGLEKSGYFCSHPQITLTELSAVLNTNRTTLSNYINNVKNMSFYDYINESRLKVSENLVKEGRLTQEEIAIRSGFNSTSTFRRAFNKKYGISPMDYRKKYRQFTD